MQIESVVFYVFFGDSGGDYNVWMLIVGSYQFFVCDYLGIGGGGLVGIDYMIGFSVLSDGVGGGEILEDGDGFYCVFGMFWQWYKVIVEFDGFGVIEIFEFNVFIDFCYQVEFIGFFGQVFSVFGYFVGDGDGQGSGYWWYVYFFFDEQGFWSYCIFLCFGMDIVIDLMEMMGLVLFLFDGGQGQFIVVVLNKVVFDFCVVNWGLFKNCGYYYLMMYQGEFWVKVGLDVLENFFGYMGFDNMMIGNNCYIFVVYVGDWCLGDFDWSVVGLVNVGCVIIGVLNYIVDCGVNFIYFLLMNVGGDGKDIFLIIGFQVKDCFDFLKL